MEWFWRAVAWLFGRNEGKAEQRQADQAASDAATGRISDAEQTAPHDATETDKRVDDKGV